MTGILKIARVVSTPLRRGELGLRRDQDLSEQRRNVGGTWPTYAPSHALANTARLAPRGAATFQSPRGEVTVCHQHFAPFLRGRYAPQDLATLHAELRKAGIVDVPLTAANLVPAGSDGGVTASFGYGAAWWRDTALIGIAFADERAVQLAKGLAGNALSTNQTHRFLTGICHGGPAGDPADMPQIKVSADGTDLTSRWGHNQLDALGLGLFNMATAASDDSFKELSDLAKSSALVAAYLTRIDFTTVPCNGHWEESGPNGEGAILTSSLGCVVHGMKALQRWMACDDDRAGRLDDYLRSLDKTVTGLGETLRTVDDNGNLLFSFQRGDLRAAVEKGSRVIRARHVAGEWHETFRDAMGRPRKTDLALSTFALLELKCPEHDRVMTRPQLVGLVNQLERDLKGPMGYRRYNTDGWLAAYYGADGPDPKARAEIGHHIAQRDKMIIGTSPEWTLGNGIMTYLPARIAIETGDVRFRDRAHEHLNRLVGNISLDPTQGRRLVINELFMHVREENNRFRYVGNGLDLNWAHAYVQLGVQAVRDLVVAEKR